MNPISKRRPRIFVSHSHLDNAFCHPFLAHLRSALHLSDPDDIFFDESSMHSGEQWLTRIQNEIQSRPVFIVLLSKNSVVAEWVRVETTFAIQRQVRSTERRIIPVLIDDCDPSQLAAFLETYQMVDFTTKSYDKAFDELVATLSGDIVSVTQARTRTVDWRHGGDHVTINEAIAAAQPGECIIIRPGRYPEEVIIDKSIELRGDGPREAIVISPDKSTAVVFRAANGVIADVTVSTSSGGNWYGIDVTSGRLDIENCDITSQSFACVVIRDGAESQLRRNYIHHGAQSGVYVLDQGHGVLENNDIANSMYAGVQVKAGGSLILRHNRIHDGAASGVYVYESGTVQLDAENEIAHNAKSGVQVKAGHAELRGKNRIHDNGEHGVLVHMGGSALLEGGNEIAFNKKNGLQASSKGSVTVRGTNHIHNNEESGVFVANDGRATVTENEIEENNLSGVSIKGANGLLQRNRINHNRGVGLRVREGGSATVIDNDLSDNVKGAWFIEDSSASNVQFSGSNKK